MALVAKSAGLNVLAGSSRIWAKPSVAIDTLLPYSSTCMTLHDSHIACKRAAREPPKTVNPKGYIVVLEEDPLIRPLLEHWLDEAGYTAVPGAAPGHGKPVLVIADVPEPQSADRLIRSLREYAAPILVLSARFRRGLGGSEDAAGRLGVKKVLPKPFTRKELLAAVRESVAA